MRLGDVLNDYLMRQVWIKPKGLLILTESIKQTCGTNSNLLFACRGQFGNHHLSYIYIYIYISAAVKIKPHSITHLLSPQWVKWKKFSWAAE